MFEKILIANRGEIAIRVARACKEMGITSVAVYSEADRDAPHVKACDEAFLIGPAVPSESYLSIEKIIQACRDSGAEAVHPGYGFLAENADFARALDEAGINFIGPPATAIDAMGSKTMAREVMEKAGVPIVPGATEPAKDLEEAKAQAEAAGYPVACKAVGGGGGKGFRVAMTADELQEAFEGSAREGEKFFSDDRVYVERYLEDPRHVEVQVLADKHGNVIHLGERDCSIQRRHQKVIEEAPGPHVDEEMRERIGKIATDAARAVGYFSAGTIEGMQYGDEYFFLEMNTRVQVEHCVTEAITGVDIVREQIKIAYGEELSLSQEDVEIKGWAIECRINAEKADKNFAPAPGPIDVYDEPSGPGVRVDSGVKAGSEVTPMYDPMVAKLIVWDKDREAATRRMLRALDEYEIAPLSTLIPFHKKILRTDQWARGETCRDLMEDKKWLKTTAPEDSLIPEPAEGEAEKVARDYLVEVSGKRFDVKVIGEATGFAAGAAPAAGGPKPKREKKAGAGGGGGGPVLASPLQGSIFKLEVAEGAEVAEGDLICVIEAMKMENEITAHKGGKVTKVSISVGDAVASGDPLVTIE
ncbi:MAG: acetyl-CoA carboxylase biotin carboxylase subunit [Solirubrobacterales bacterium]|nr:acetyl-CoA carboxylase biotin carboxylase subunit [Solirubrobacterales bacterium]MCB8914339.1 acetyl-CoA carboxylase biotin carboxylase subunit [Thermoleophilales bacterium]